MPLTLAVVTYAAEECERQRSGERSVAWMVAGWEYATKRAYRQPFERDVLALGRIVEPRKAADGYRRVGVRVGWNVKGPWEQVPRQMAALMAARHLEPDEWFREYEEIHPFADGNGRTGSLLWNWKRGTLDAPAAPPDFWN